MKLLRFEVEGLDLMKESIAVDFYTRQQVREDDKFLLHHLVSNIYLNTANAFIGINASGKTTLLRVTNLVLDMLNNRPLNHAIGKEVLANSPTVTVTSYIFIEPNVLFKLETTITTTIRPNGGVHCSISDETLWKKTLPQNTPIVKKALFEFSDRQIYIRRSESGDFLSDDVSIMIAVNKQYDSTVLVASLEPITDFNTLAVSDVDVPSELLHFLDATIERFYIELRDGKPVSHLKFYGRNELILADTFELRTYLSSGTIKGINVFLWAIAVLRHGGYLLLDEIENHFNTEIVASLIRFFLDARLNKNGGVLIFTTHYPELLDEFDRNDCINITRNTEGISVQNLTDILKRNDLKKSDAYMSDYLGGTAPLYDSYIALKRYIAKAIEGGGAE